MQVIESRVEEMSGSELLDHVDLLEQSRRRVEAEILRAAVHHAVLHDADSLDAEVSSLPGRERAVPLGGEGTPEVAEFAGADFGARLRVSDYAGRQWIADGLDLAFRLPRLWARVQALEVRASYARFVAQKTRALSRDQARCVDARVAASADGRIPWSRFETLVQAAIVAADPIAAAEREQAAAREQFAKPTRSTEHGMRSFWIRGPFATIARFDATVAFLAQVLADLGDEDPLDLRRVKAVLVLANPVHAVELLTAYAAWRDRPADPPIPADPTIPTDDQAPPPEQQDARTGAKPVIDWSQLLPSVVLFLHVYRGDDRTGVVRVEDVGPVTEGWMRAMLGPHARFKVHPVIDLAGQAPVDAYEVPDRHRQAVHLITPADIFPFSSNLTRHKQVDHTEPF